MTTPTSGPFTVSVGTDLGSRPFVMTRTWYRQKKPYNLTLPFTYSTGQGVGLFGGAPPGGAAFTQVWTTNPWTQQAEDACRNKLFSKLGEASMWMVNILEREQTISMLAGYFRKLRLGYQAVRKGQFRKANKLLGFPTDKGVSRRRQFGDNLLAYKFGIKPLFEDIFAAVNTLQNPLPKRKISSKARSFRLSGLAVAPTVRGTSSDYEQYEYSVRSGGRIEISNPDLFLANQLGLVNPAAVVWESIPFSFLFDWLLPVGDFLNKMTATLGLTFTGGWTTVGIRFYRRYLYLDYYGLMTGFAGNSFYVRRTGGMLALVPTLSTQSPFSVSRAITSFGLLMQTRLGGRR